MLLIICKILVIANALLDIAVATYGYYKEPDFDLKDVAQYGVIFLALIYILVKG